MTEKVQRASFDELLSFANSVRRAGGGNPLDALMPAVPEDASQCLIAKNLNFNCYVDTLGPDDPHWYMVVDDVNLAKSICKELDLIYIDHPHIDYPTELEFAIRLPLEIGQVAQDFDQWVNSFEYDEDTDSYIIDDEEEFKAFMPYVEASYNEVCEIAEINDKGEIVL